jgi:hypothetical protein
VRNFIVNSTGKRVSVILPISEYEALLQAVANNETEFLLREPNGSILRRRIENIRQGRNIVEQELLPDESRY